MEFAMKSVTPLPGGLPSEIWHCILEMLDHVDHSSLKSVVLCSSDMYKLAAPILFKTLYIGSEEFWFNRMWKGRMHPIYLCIHVRTIIVVNPRRKFWESRWFHFPEAFMKSLYHLLKMTENLQDFCWWHDKYMPGEILYQLYRYRPQARVHIASSKAALCERINQKHTSSPQLSCIRSIEAKWCLAEYDEPIRPNSAASYPAQLRDIIIRCKNLQSLTLVCTGEFRLRRRDVSPYMERKEGEAMRNYRDRVTLKEGDILPDVKNVQFRNMRFGPIQSELWATHLQWQNIKHLSLIQVYWTHLLPKITVKGFFHALEGLEMSVPNPMYPDRNRPAQIECINQFHNFLKELPPLKRFIGYGFPQDTLAVLAEYHSNSLAHLRFRCHLNSGTGIHGSYGEDRPFRASINNLDSLLCQFPNLHSLGLNVDWAPDEKLPYDLLAKIVLQTHIQHFELHLPHLRRHRIGSWPYPNADVNTCQELFQSLDEISTNLLSIHIVIGDWYPFRVGSQWPWFLEAFLIGERDYAGCMRFRKLRQFLQSACLAREGDFVPDVPPWVMKGAWPKDLRQDIEGRIGDMFCGKMRRDLRSGG